MSPVLINPFLGGGGGGGGPAAPADGSHLLVWLRGDSNMYSDAGTTLVTANGSTVFQWNDLSGNGNHAVHNTGLFALDGSPTLETAGLNSQNVVRFTAASKQTLTLPNIFVALTSGEAFIVVKKVADPANTPDNVTAFWDFGADGGGGGLNSHVTYSDGNIYEVFGSTARKSCGNPTPSFASTYRVYSVYSAPGDWQNFIDGSSFFSTGTNTVQFPGNGAGPSGSSTRCNLGSGHSSPSVNFYADMRVAEFLFYNHKLSGPDRSTVTTYLGARYGLF